jgi:hypothetical protein
MGEIRNAHILVEDPEVKRSLGRPMLRREDNIRVDLRGTEWEFRDWMHPAQDRDQWRALVDTVISLCVPYPLYYNPRCM